MSQVGADESDVTVDLTVDPGSDDDPEPDLGDPEPDAVGEAPFDPEPPAMDGDSTVDLTVDPADLAEIRAAWRQGSPGEATPPDAAAVRRQSSDSAGVLGLLRGILAAVLGGILGLVLGAFLRLVALGGVVLVPLSRRPGLGAGSRGPRGRRVGGPGLVDLDDLLLDQRPAPRRSRSGSAPRPCGPQSGTGSAVAPVPG